MWAQPSASQSERGLSVARAGAGSLRAVAPADLGLPGAQEGTDWARAGHSPESAGLSSESEQLRPEGASGAAKDPPRSQIQTVA